MRAVVAESADQLTWLEVPDVSPQTGEVLIEVSAAGVNRADLLQGDANPHAGHDQSGQHQGQRPGARSAYRLHLVGAR